MSSNIEENDCTDFANRSTDYSANDEPQEILFEWQEIECPLKKKVAISERREDLADLLETAVENNNDVCVSTLVTEWNMLLSERDQLMRQEFEEELENERNEAFTDLLEVITRFRKVTISEETPRFKEINETIDKCILEADEYCKSHELGPYKKKAAPPPPPPPPPFPTITFKTKKLTPYSTPAMSRSNSCNSLRSTGTLSEGENDENNSPNTANLFTSTLSHKENLLNSIKTRSLKKTNQELSPGGTPKRRAPIKRNFSPSSNIQKALIEKFKTIETPPSESLNVWFEDWSPGKTLK